MLSYKTVHTLASVSNGLLVVMSYSMVDAAEMLSMLSSLALAAASESELQSSESQSSNGKLVRGILCEATPNFEAFAVLRFFSVIWREVIWR